MALSDDLKNRINVATASPTAGVELSAAIDAATAADTGFGALASGAIIVGNSGGVATDVVPTGDVTIDNAGATAIGAAKVTPVKTGLAVYNGTGSSIAADKVVAVTGFDVTSGLPKIVLADADVAAHDNLWITTAAIADATAGVVAKGNLSAASLNTNSASTAGDPVYLSTTAGGFAHTAPVTGISRVHPVGFVVVKSATVGQIYWTIGPVRIIGRNELQGSAAQVISTTAGDGVGYATGAGGTVTQGAGSGKATAFSLSKLTGQITTDNAALNAGVIVSSTWTNTMIAATDVVVINHVSGGTVGSYTFNVQCGAGSATLNIRNATAGNLSEALVLQFNVIKGVTA